MAAQEPIAIVGVGCRFAGGADSADKFWALMRDGVDANREVPPNRWNIDALYDADAKVRKGKMYTKRAGFLDDITKFDPMAFGISPREAQAMDPQQRLLLEVAHEAFEDAGIPASKYHGSETGVYVGLMNHDYAVMQDGTSMNNFSSPGSASSIASNRISFAFDLRGPSLTIDTACSSSLVGAHFAVQSLRTGETDMSVVGGVNVMASPTVNIALSRIGMLSPDGRCKAFDASGDGYGRGEGAGIVILKRLSDAIRDGDQVYCTILGTSVNSDGRGSTPITAPNQGQQERMLRRAYAMAGVRPSDVQYMEAHGTGTLRGDPIEAGALGAVLSDGRPATQTLAVGSVKTNIGHVEAGAGVAGLIKVCLSMRHAKVPPSLHFKNPNPLIDFQKLNMRVVTALEPWPAATGQRKLAGCNSFGFGGTNSHAVLSSPPTECDRGRPWSQPRETRVPAGGAAPVYAVPVSGYTNDALLTMANMYANTLRTTPARVVDVAYSASMRRSRHKYRAVALGSTHAELAAALEEFATTGASTGSCITGHAAAEPRVAFAFSGSGTAWPRMGADLMQAHPVFAACVREVDTVLQRHSGWSVEAELQRPKAESRMGDLRCVQVCIFAMQVALVRLLRSWSVQPVAVVGHSVGEVAAAVTAGLMSLEDGVQLVLRLGHFAHSVEGDGYMVTAATSVATATAAIAELSNQVGIAAVNDENNVTLAGFTAGLDTVVARLSAQGVNTVRVALGAPFHTVGVEQFRDRYFAQFGTLPPLTAAAAAAAGTGGAPRMYSTCRPGAVVPGAAGAGASAGAPVLSLDCAYWWDNARQTVQFADVVTSVTAEQGITAWVEIGPSASLAVSLSSLAKAAKAWVVPTVRAVNPVGSVAQAAASLFASGVEVSWASQFEGQACRMADLPLYPWNHSVSYWLEGRNHYCHRVGFGIPKPLLDIFWPLAVSDDSVVYEADVSTDTLPLLADHVYQKSLLLPATMYMELCLALGKHLFGDDEFSVHSLDLPSAMWFAADETREVRVSAVQRRDEGAGAGEESKGQPGNYESKDAGAGDDDEVDTRVFDITVTSRRKKPGSDDSQGAVTVHSTAVLRAAPLSSHSDTVPVDFSEVQGLQERGEVISKEQWYQNFAAVGFDFGPRFQNIAQAWKAIPVALGELTVGDLIKGGMGDFVFHPGILDAAGQVLDATVSAESSIPVNIGRISAHAPLDVAKHGKLYSYARMTGRTEDDKGKKFVLGDVFMFSEEGQLLLTLAQFSCQVLDPNQGVAHVNSADDSVYDITYAKAPLPAAEATSVPGNSLVIVPRGAASITGGDFTTLLASLGANETPRRCVVVEQDTRRVMAAADLQRLISESFIGGSSGSRRRRRGNKIPDLKRVVLLFHDPRGFDDLAPGTAARAQAVSHYVAATVLHVSQAVGNIYSRHMSAAPWVYFVTCGAVAPTGPDSGLPSLLSSVHGSCHGYRRTLAHEFPSLRMRCVDMGFAPGTGSRDVAALVDELGSRPEDEEVALRDGERYVARYAPVPTSEVSAEVGASFTCRADASYVIIGGCRGLGLKLAGFLKSRGARHLVLVSRSGVAPAAEAEVDALAQGGCKVMVSKTDVTDEASVTEMFQGLADSAPPVRGVVHSAMVLDDGLVLSQTARRVERVLDPKVLGAILVHRAVANMELDFFTLFSSTTALFGNQGQFSYGGANAVLDALAHRRHRLGMPAVSVNWGAFKGIGYLARNTSVEKQLQQRGWEGIDQPTFFDFFARFTAARLPQTSLALADMGKWFRHQPWALTSPMYTALARMAEASMAAAGGHGEGAGAGELLREVQGLGDADALPVVVAWTRGIIAMSLDVGADEVDVEISFPQLGVDSLMGMEVRNLVAEQLEVDMPLALMFGNTSVASLSEFLLQQVRQKSPVDADAAAAAAVPDTATSPAPAAASAKPAGSVSTANPSTASAAPKVPTPTPTPSADAAKAAASHLPYGMHAPVVVQSASVAAADPLVLTSTSPVRVAKDRAAAPSWRSSANPSLALPNATSPATPATPAQPTAWNAYSRPDSAPTQGTRAGGTWNGPSSAAARPTTGAGAFAGAGAGTPAPATTTTTTPSSQPPWSAPSPAARAPPAAWSTAPQQTPPSPTPVTTTVPATVLTAWLSRAMATKNKASPLPKYAYPSPGSLHPVQVYLVLPPLDPSAKVTGSADVPSRVEGVPAGNYYYHPVEHQLYGLRDPASESTRALAAALEAACPEHASTAPCPFFAVLVGSMAAIEPLYGAAARPFLFFEAGAITRALKDGGSEAGVPLKYKTVAQYSAEQEAALSDALALTAGDHVLLRSVFVTLA